MSEIAVEIDAASTLCYQGPADRWLHLQCAADTSVRYSSYLIITDRRSFEGRAEFESIVRARSRAIYLSQRPPAERAKHQAELQIEPARHPDGRPRVRLLMVGNGWPYFESNFDGPKKVGAILGSVSGVPPVLCSSRREYLFTTRISRPFVDHPVEPFAALVIAMRADRTLSGSNFVVADTFRVVRLYQSLKLPPPILWVIGNFESPAKQDEFVLKFRHNVERTGLDPDACPVLVAPMVTVASARALLDTVDELLENNIDLRLSLPVKASAEQGSMENTLQALVDSRHEHSISRGLTKALAEVKTADVTTRAALTRLGYECFRFRALRHKALKLIDACAVPLELEPLLSTVKEAVGDLTHPLSAEFSLMISLLVRNGHQDEVAVLLHRAAYATEQTPTRKKKLLQLHRMVSLAATEATS